MDDRIYAWDDPTIGSSKMKKFGLGTFNNKEQLKQMGMQYDPEVRRWFATSPNFDAQKLKDIGIIMDKGVALGDKSNAFPGIAILSNFERRGTFIESAKFRFIGKNREGREIFEIEKDDASELGKDNDLVDGNALVKKHWESVKHLSPIKQLARAIELEDDVKNQKAR